MNDPRLAESLVVMIAAGGAWADVVTLAEAHGVRATQLRRLAVPQDLELSRQRLITLLEPDPPVSGVRVS